MQRSGYSHRTLAEKLGLKPGMTAYLVNAPDGYREALGDAATHADFVTSLDGAAALDFIHAFFTDRTALLAHLPPLKAALAPTGALWISWPKKSAKVPTDVDEAVVHEAGLAAGLVDVKVAAIDPVWSGFKFVYRLKDR
jgi:hypothetical protein